MNQSRLIYAGLLLTTGMAMAQTPTVTGVYNGGSYDTKIARGSIFVAFGTNLGPSSLVQAGAPPLQPALSGTSISFTPVGGGSAVSALMFYTLSSQVAGLLPSTAAAGDYNVTVTYNGATSAGFKVTVVDRSFGIVSLAGNGKGPAVVQNYNSATSTPINGYTAAGGYTPAYPGQTLIIWGTGLGPITASDADAPGVQDLRGAATIKVVVGGRQIDPFYAGRAPQFPGEDQINVTLPADIETGCNVSLQISVNGAMSNQTTVAIASAQGAAACVHPFLSSDQLTKLMSGGSLTMGVFSLSKQTSKISFGGISLTSVAESIGGGFSKYTLGSIDEAGGAAGAALFTQIGSCTVIKQVIEGTNFAGAGPSPLDAGAQLTLNGPGVSSKAVPKNAGVYSAGLNTSQSQTGVLTAGTYTLTGPGGADVGPFTATINLATPVTWTNQDATTEINRSQALPITWSGGGSSDVVSILGMSGIVSGIGADATTDAKIFLCLAKASDGNFTVPTTVLSQLDPVPASSTTGIGLLAVTSGTAPAPFTAPLTAGGNVDYAYIVGSSGGSKTLPIQ